MEGPQEEQPKLSKLTQFLHKVNAGTVGAVASVFVANKLGIDPAQSTEVAAAVAATGAGASTGAKQAYDSMIAAITGANKGDPEFEEFSKHLSEFLSAHPNRLDGFIGLNEDSKEHFQPYVKTYNALYNNIYAVEDDLKQQVMMRALAKSAIKDADQAALPNADTMRSVLGQVQQMTPRQMAMLSLISNNEITSFARDSAWMKDDAPDHSNINDRILFQELYKLMSGPVPLVKHRPVQLRRKSIHGEAIEEPVKSWTEIDADRLDLTRNGQEFVNLLDLQKLNPEYRNQVLGQLDPLGRDFRQKREESIQNRADWELGP